MAEDGMREKPTTAMEAFAVRPQIPLPAGVTKEVLTEAPASSSLRRPGPGDGVSVHYTGKFDNGDKFDSSHDRGQPANITLGKKEVIQGWEVALPSMRTGEIARFVIAPEFAYGEKGMEPSIPGNATLTFEIEMLSWTSKDDLFGDGSALRVLLVDGVGWKEPQDGDEVEISFKTFATDGTVLEQKENVAFVMGSGDLGKLAPVLSKALQEMKKEDKIALKCSKEYASASSGEVLVELTLHEIYQTEDVSPDKEFRTCIIKKKLVREGETAMDNPKDGAKVKMLVLQVTDGEGRDLGFSGPKEFEAVAGNGDICEALEFAILSMAKGEKAIITCTRPELCTFNLLARPPEPAVEKVMVTVILQECDNPKDHYQMEDKEKLDFCSSRKDMGAKLVKDKRFDLALDRYVKVIALLENVDYLKQDSDKSKAAEIRRLCRLNQAMCQLKTGDLYGAKVACDKVLEEDPDNLKAIFRRGNAYFGRREFEEAQVDLRRVLELDPANAEAKRMLQQAQRGEKEQDKKAKSMYHNMAKGFGKIFADKADPLDPNRVLTLSEKEDLEIQKKADDIMRITAEQDAQEKAEKDAREKAEKAGRETADGA